LALSIGAAIFDLTVREISLSGAATQSQYAVYAADSGAECALYWDSRYINAGTNNNGGSGSAFATSSGDTIYATSGILCNGVDVAPAAIAASPTTWPLSSDANAATTTFTVIGTTYKNQTPCAIVYVAKVGNPSITTITSHGYNTGTASCGAVNGQLQLERVLQVSY
jgi:hypothetical protein